MKAPLFQCGTTTPKMHWSSGIVQVIFGLSTGQSVAGCVFRLVPCSVKYVVNPCAVKKFIA